LAADDSEEEGDQDDQDKTARQAHNHHELFVGKQFTNEEPATIH